METITLRREELYAAVWQKALRAVAASYDISDVALRKICRKLTVPIPPRGYWAQLAAGKKVRIPPLPRLKSGGISEHSLAHSQVSPRAFRREYPAEQRIIVPDTLERPHRLVRSSLAALRRSAKTMSRATYTESCLDIVASQTCLDRALRIMDSLLKALEGCGYVVEVTTPEKAYGGSAPSPSATRALVEGEWISFSLAERRVDAEVEGSKGELTLRILNAPWGVRLRKSWSDGKKQRIENCLGDFIVSLVGISEALKEERADRERREQEWAEARKRQEELRRRSEIEQRLRYDLSARAADWNESRQMEFFLDAFEKEMAARVELDEDAIAKRMQWLAWARQYVGSLRVNTLKLLELRTPPAQESRFQTWGALWPPVTSEEIAAYLITYQNDTHSRE